MNYWLVKAHDKPTSTNDGWHWNDYFEAPEAENWGGPKWIRGNVSHHRIEEVRRGDLIICYQVDERAVMGLTRTIADGKQCNTAECFCLIPIGARCLRLARPALLTQSERQAVHCLGGGKGFFGQGTIFPITLPEAFAIVSAMVRENPRRERAILRCFSDPQSFKSAK